MTYGRRLLKKLKRNLVEIRIQNTKGRLIEKYLLKILIQKKKEENTERKVDGL